MWPIEQLYIKLGKEAGFHASYHLLFSISDQWTLLLMLFLAAELSFIYTGYLLGTSDPNSLLGQN